MSRTIEAIMRHMAAPSTSASNSGNGTEKLEKEITVRKRHYVWSEARFARAMIPFYSMCVSPTTARKSTAKVSST